MNQTRSGGRTHQLLGVVVVGLASASLLGSATQTGSSSQDPSNHQIRFVTVAPGVNLELLDWGGSGRSIILLAGSGNTGHTFDEFAPELLDCCHVYAITRRGYGASSWPAEGYGWQRLAEDVVQVIEREHIPS